MPDTVKYYAEFRNDYHEIQFVRIEWYALPEEVHDSKALSESALSALSMCANPRWIREGQLIKTGLV